MPPARGSLPRAQKPECSCVAKVIVLGKRIETFLFLHRGRVSLEPHSHSSTLSRRARMGGVGASRRVHRVVRIREVCWLIVYRVMVSPGVWEGRGGSSTAAASLDTSGWLAVREADRQSTVQRLEPSGRGFLLPIFNFFFFKFFLGTPISLFGACGEQH